MKREQGEYEAIRDAYRRGHASYSSRWAEPHPFLEPERALMRSLLPIGGTVLDVGCGPGSESAYLVNAGYSVVGIDTCEDFLVEARQRVPKAKFLRMDMRSLELAPSSFDGVWVGFSFLHIHRSDSEMVLRELKHVLAPRGVMLLALHTAAETRWVNTPIVGLAQDDSAISTYVQEWNLDDIKELVARHFTVESFRPFTRPSGIYPLLAIVCRRSEDARE